MTTSAAGRESRSTNVPVEAMLAPGGTLWGYPKGVYLLSFTELWERFSYYGLMALLVLYLNAGVAAGGFGWSQQDALKLYAAYTALAFVGPLFGGWIASRYWGERRCIVVGALLIVLGHLCLAGPAFVPAVAAQLTSVDYRQLWADSGAPLGLLFIESEARAQILATGATSLLVYRLTAGSFFLGLLLIISGTAFIKPTVSSIVGRFFASGDARRDGAFALFMTGMYVGIIAGVLIAGYCGERVGWHWGFGAAGLGMACGLVVYLWKQSAYLADIGTQAPRSALGASRRLRDLRPEEWDRIKVIFLLGAFTAVFTGGSNQAGGLLTLFARDHVDRFVLGWQVPASWLLLSGSLVYVLSAAPVARLWERLAREERNPSAVVKLAWGLMALGVGYAIITLAATTVPTAAGTKVQIFWMVLMYALFGFAEVLVYANQISLTSKLAPHEWSALFIGGWYIQAAIGNSVTGYVGAMSYTWGMTSVFAGSAIAFIALGGVVWLLAPSLVRLMHGIKG